MKKDRKSLEVLRNECRQAGWGVRDWAKKAGLSWQTLYRKLKRPETVLLSEYDALEKAARVLSQKPKEKKA